MAKNKVVFGKDFHKNKNALSSDDQYFLDRLIGDIQYDKLPPGANREFIKCKSGENVFSFRVNRDVRLAAYLWKPKEYLLIACGHHDDLYNKVKRCRLSTQKAAELPVLEEVDFEVDESQTDSTPIVIGKTQIEADNILKQVFNNRLVDIANEDLLKLNLTIDVINSLKAATTEEALIDEVMKLQSSKIRDGLLDVSLGELSIEDLIETYKKEREAPRRSVDVILDKNLADRENYFILNDEILELYMNGQLENWQVYLHADQTRGVEMEARGPMMVTGPAGTGKSVVAVHRVKWLLRNAFKARGKILFTTYTHTLAEYAKKLLASLCTDEELRRVEVVHFDKFFQHLLRRKIPNLSINYSGKSPLGPHYAAYLSKIFEIYKGTKDKLFIETEFDRVISEYNITTLKEYLDVVRPKDLGRLSTEARTQLWPIFERLNAYKGFANITPRALAINMLTEAISPEDCEFSSIVVDEAQDFGAPEYRLFAKLTGNSYSNAIPYSLFFAGDGHQRIYNRSGSLKQCGINVTGRSIHLIKCYRSTKRIREYAEKIIANVQVKDMDEEIDSLHGCESLAEGITPDIRFGEDRESKNFIIQSKIKKWNSSGIKLGDCAILVRSNKKLDALVDGLSRYGIKAIKVDRDNVSFDDDSVKVMTMHRAKGLQFVNVIVDVDGWPTRNKTEDDEDVLTQMLAREKCVLYMSIMRAMNDVLITGSYRNRYIPTV